MIDLIQKCVSPKIFTKVHRVHVLGLWPNRLWPKPTLANEFGFYVWLVSVCLWLVSVCESVCVCVHVCVLGVLGVVQIFAGVIQMFMDFSGCDPDVLGCRVLVVCPATTGKGQDTPSIGGGRWRRSSQQGGVPKPSGNRRRGIGSITSKGVPLRSSVGTLRFCGGSKFAGCSQTGTTFSTGAISQFRLRPISTSAKFDFGQFLDVEFLDHKGWGPKGGAQTWKEWGPEGWGPQGWAETVLAKSVLCLSVFGPIHFLPNLVFFARPRSLGPRRVGARRVGSAGGAPKGGGPKILRFFPSPAPFSLFLSLSEGLLVVFWWCLEAPGPSNVHGVLRKGVRGTGFRRKVVQNKNHTTTRQNTPRTNKLVVV